MIINVSKETYEAKWYKVDDGAELKIRPYAVGQGDIIFRDGEVVQSGRDRWKMFDYSLVAWKGITDADGKDLKMSDKVKKMVFDYSLGDIATFVIIKNGELLKERQEQEKN
jgi:hypothetical protein